MISSISVNFFLALWIARLKSGKGSQKRRKQQRCVLVLSVIFNVGLLWFFKYFHTFALFLKDILGAKDMKIMEIALPLGISFYTFQILSYVIDVYMGKCEVQRNFIHFALYVSFFPQLVAGPIVKYKDVAYQIENRKQDAVTIAVGIKRFIYGLSKKVIISNTVAAVADSIFAVSYDEISSKWLWVATGLYTLQIYYDFSGYSDMAIGLGKMFGFDFLENFNYPYVSESIQEFWRRWHISLSSWFKEYVYIPLGGNRKGKIRTNVNLCSVFLITGIWHGATLNFVAWGCLHGLFSLLERGVLGKWLKRNKVKAINHVYTMAVVGVGWAIFRCDSMKEAWQLLKHMFLWTSNYHYVWYDFFSIRSLVVILIAVLLIGFIQDKNDRIRGILFAKDRVYPLELLLQTVLLIICIILLIGGQYNPFIYFKF